MQRWRQGINAGGGAKTARVPTASEASKMFTGHTFQIGLKALIQPECLARVASWLAFVVTIFMGHENGDNKGQLRDDASKACWLNKSL